MAEAIKGFYKVAVGVWRIPPSEFWNMTPMEWWWLHDLQQERMGPRPRTKQEIERELQELEDFARQNS